MGSLSQAKTYGGIGAILALVGAIVPSFGFVITIAGLILLLIAVKYIAEVFRDENIFNNYLYSIILGIVALVAIAVIFFVTIGSLGLDLTEMSEITTEKEARDFFEGKLGTFLSGCLTALFVGWILYLISAIFLRKSYNSIAEKTGVNLFATTGLVYLIGAATVIIGIGLIIILVARILEIISFFSLPDASQKATQSGAGFGVMGPTDN